MTSALRAKPYEEPIAIVGIACRLPGAAQPASLWQLLRQGRQALGDVPAERWSGAAYYHPNRSTPGKTCTLRAGFLEDVAGFDPEFFGISPREAMHIDPQQRLALELSWEVLEDAGIAAHTLQGSAAGVFFGAMWTDYEKLHAIKDISQHSGTGWHLGVVPGRVSYALGLRGPSMAVNTACSSSLVAVHLACRSLLAGECSVALAGGVSLMLAPHVSVAMSQFGGTSPSSRTYAYDARADGYVRGEGGGVVILRRMSEAQRRGERIYALIRGSAVNNDGFSEGLTAPSGEAQRIVLAEAYAVAGVAPDEVDYVEGHGTGTAIGDPIEANALGAVLGAGRSAERPLWLGSIKTNIGHTEAASGVAGLLKVVLALKHRQLPASLNFEQPNPAIFFERNHLAVVQRAMPWPTQRELPLAGVNSFGFGGTNCHLVVQAAPPHTTFAKPASEATDCDGRAPLAPHDEFAHAPSYQHIAVSAHSLEALQARLDQLAQLDNALAVNDIRTTLEQGRTALPWRAGIVCRDTAQLRDKLRNNDVVRGIRRVVEPVRPVLVYSGHGSQWAAMGRVLAAREPVFQQSLRRCSAALERHSGWSLADLIERAALDDRMQRVDDIQPAIFAIQVALTDTLRHYSVTPGAVVGHSMGEVAAAYAAGALSLEDAALLTWSRAEVLARISGHGGMLSISLPCGATERVLEGFDAISIAVDSGTGYTVVSGPLEALSRLAESLQTKEIECRHVKVDVAAHSAQIDPLSADLQAAVAAIQPRDSGIAMMSSVTGHWVTGAQLGPSYWTRNIRERVRFGPAVEQLLETGHRLFIEVSPHPLLLFLLREMGKRTSLELQLGGLMSNKQDDEEAWLNGLASLHAAGCSVDWSARRLPRGRIVSLPPYPWQRRPFWPARERAENAPTAQFGFSTAAHSTPEDDEQLSVRYQPSRHPLMGQHLISGRPLLAAGVAIDLMRRAALLTVDDGQWAICDIHFHHPIDIRDGSLMLSVRAGQVALTPLDRAPPSGASPSITAVLLQDDKPLSNPQLDLQALKARSVESRQDHYGQLARRGIHYHDTLRSICDLHRGQHAVLVSLAAGLPLAAQLDACFQAAMQALGGADAARWLVQRVGRVQIDATRPASAVYAWMTRQGRSSSLAGALLLNDAGETVGALDEISFVQAAVARRTAITLRARRLQPCLAAPTPTLAGASWSLISSSTELRKAIRGALAAYRVPIVEPPNSVTGNGAPESPRQQLVIIEYQDATDRASAALAACEALRNAVRSIGPNVVRVVVAVEEGVEPEPPALGSSAAAVWAMARVLAHERPSLRVHSLQFRRGASTELAREIAAMQSIAAPLPAASGELASEVVLSSKGRWQAQLAEIEPITSTRSAVAPAGSVIISGGLGAIGRHVSAALVTAGYADLVLLGRRALDDEASAFIADLAAQGASVRYEQLDVRDRDALAGLFERVNKQGTIAGVIHSAATLVDARIEQLGPEQLASVFATKAQAAWWLHELTAELPLAFFVMFGSLGGYVGLAGQAAYAAANAFVDALAETRRRANLPALSIGWCGWHETGFAATTAGRAALAALSERGYDALSADDAVALFLRLLRSSTAASVAVMPAASKRASPSHAQRDAAQQFAISLRATRPLSRRQSLLRAQIVEEAAAVLKQSAERVQLDAPLRDQGLDSMMTVELRDRIERMVALELPRTLIWQHPTVSALTAHLLKQLQLDTEPGTAAGLNAALMAQPPERQDARDAAHQHDLNALLDAIESMPEDAVKEMLDG